MRQEFPKHVKRAALTRACGYCEGCQSPLRVGRFDFDHDREATFGGEPTLANCAVLCRACHGAKTRNRAAVIAKSNRVRDKFNGIRKTQARPLAGTKASGLRKRMNGTVEIR